ncbi:MAG: hypothetical protein ACR2JU_04655 [Nocardioidaceae bacterium]
MTEPQPPNDPSDRIFRDHMEDDLAARGPLTSGEPGEEDIDAAQESEDLEQDPREVPNRIAKAEPPRPERVGPWDDDEDVPSA